MQLPGTWPIEGVHEFFFCMDERRPSTHASWRDCAKTLSFPG
jgi:hypothetical protein